MPPRPLSQHTSQLPKDGTWAARAWAQARRSPSSKPLREQLPRDSPLLCGHPFKYGETFMFESTGGGGYGNPWERDAAMVLEDVLDEYVSLKAARERYGVVIDPATMKIDEAATAKLRASMSSKTAA